MAEAPPRFRRDLQAKPGTADGISFVDVSDPSTGRSFRFYDFEYALAQQLDGRPLDEVARRMGQTYGMELTAEGLEPFIRQLVSLGFLAPSASSPSTPLESGALEMIALSTAPTPVGTFDAHHPALVRGQSRGQARADQGRLAVPSLPSLASVTTSAVPPPPVPWLGEDDAFAVSELAFSAVTTERPAGHETTGSAPSRARAMPSRSPSVVPALRALSDLLPAPLETRSEEPAEQAAPHAVQLGLSDNDAKTSPTTLDSLASGTEPEARHTQDGAGLEGRLEGRREGRREDRLEDPADDAVGAQATALSSEDGREDTRDAMHAPDGDELGHRPSSLSSPPSPPSSAALFRQSPTEADWAHALERHVDAPTGPVRAAPAAPAVAVKAETSSEVVARPARQARWPWAVGAAAATVAAGLLYLKQGDEAPVIPVNAPVVHTLVPTPATIYRWFDAQGTVMPGEDKGLSFDIPGKLQETLAPGTSFSTGQVLAKLVGSALREKELNYARSRLVVYEQMLETALAQKNQPQIRLNRAKIEEKKRNVERAVAAWRHYVIIAEAPGEVGPLQAKVGEKVAAGAVVLDVRATGPHAEWPLTPLESTQARALGFCRVETLPTAQASARAAECTLPAEPTIGKPFVVDLPRNVGGSFMVGQPVRLARARYEGVFPVPRTALRETPLGSQVFVVSSQPTILRARTVRIVDLGSDEALVAAGLNVGDVVVSQIAPQLADGVVVRVAPASASASVP